MSYSIAGILRLTFIILPLVAITSLPARSQSPVAGLFEDYVGTLTSEQMQIINKVRQREYVRNSRIVRFIGSNIAAEDTLSFFLFGEHVTLLRTNVDYFSGHSSSEDSMAFSWVGAPHGLDGLGIFSIDRGTLGGYIRLGDQRFKLVSLGNDLTAVLKIDPTEFTPEGNPPIPRDKSKSILKFMPKTGAIASSAVGDHRLRLLVIYTDDAASTSIGSSIQTGVSLANQSYANSQIGIDLELVASVEVSYTETGDGLTDLECITFSDGCLDNAFTLRNQYSADVVILVTETSDVAGIAWLYGGTNYAFGVVRLDYVDELTVAHEIGHIQGAQHNPGEGSSNPFFSYGYGRLMTSIASRTFMAYDSLSCCSNRVEYFSNPSVSYSGVVTGTASQDNARVLEGTKGSVALFRTTSIVSQSSSGPSCLVEGSNGYFTASTQAGEPPYSYEWEFERVCNGSKSGGQASVMDVPCGGWNYAGSGQAIYFGSDRTDDFRIRSKVLDVANQAMTSSSRYVNVVPDTSPDPCGGGAFAVKEPSMEPAQGFELGSNYPDPFNPLTTISFSLPAESYVTITVLDLLGREVGRFVDGQYSAGKHEIVLDATTFAAGVYIYRMEAGEYVESKSMLLLK